MSRDKVVRFFSALALLVQLDLGAGVGASLLKTTAEVLDVAGQSSSVLLGLGPVLPLNVQLLVQLLDPGLQLLDLLAVLGTESSFVLDLGRHGHQLLLLPLQSSTKISLDPVKVANSLLSQLEVALDLPLELLHVTLGLFLPLESILSLVERLLKLSLDLAQVVAPVLHGLDVLLGLLPALAGTLLLLGQLGDQLLLVSDLLPQGVDLVVLGALVLLALLAGGLQSLDGVPQTVGVSGHLDSGLLYAVDELFLSLDALVGVVHLLLNVVLGGLQPLSLVDDVLHRRTSRSEHSLKLVLLGNKSFVLGHNSVALAHGLANVGLSLGDLVLILLLVLGELGALEVGFDEKPDLHPLPGLGDHHGTESTLASVEGELLVLQLLELHPGRLAASASLQPGKDGTDLVLTLLLHPAANAGPEEDLGVAQPELLLVQLDHLHDSSSSGLVVLGLGHSLGGDDVVARLELRVQHLVGEALPADGDAGEHTVTLVLVHNKAWLNTSRLLVGVGHNATDEVGLGLVQGGHQVVKLTLEVGGHSLATLALLPVLVLGSLQGLAR